VKARPRDPLSTSAGYCGASPSTRLSVATLSAERDSAVAEQSRLKRKISSLEFSVERERGRTQVVSEFGEKRFNDARLLIEKLRSRRRKRVVLDELRIVEAQAVNRNLFAELNVSHVRHVREISKLERVGQGSTREFQNRVRDLETALSTRAAKQVCCY
jgi:hypothetical protein